MRSADAAQPTAEEVTDAGRAADAAAGRGRRSRATTDAIVVTGFRAALQSAVNKKKRSDQVVELVSAEDIGKLPDTRSPS